jgi:hypothetical protein
MNGGTSLRSEGVTNRRAMSSTLNRPPAAHEFRPAVAAFIRTFPAVEIPQSGVILAALTCWGPPLGCARKCRKPSKHDRIEQT